MTDIVKIMNKENGVEEQVYPQTHINAVIGYEGGSGSGGGGGGVTSVNGKTGTVVLTASDVGASATSHTHSTTAITSGILSNDRLSKASTSGQGIVKLNNTLISTLTDEALTANQGKVLNDNKLDKTANATSASKLQTARTITLSGAVTGNASFDGSSNVTINTTGNVGGGGTPSAHTHKMADVDYLEMELNKRSYVTHTHSNATTSTSGFMSGADKTKLDGMSQIRLVKIGTVN